MPDPDKAVLSQQESAKPQLVIKYVKLCRTYNLVTPRNQASLRLFLRHSRKRNSTWTRAGYNSVGVGHNSVGEAVRP